MVEFVDQIGSPRICRGISPTEFPVTIEVQAHQHVISGSQQSVRTEEDRIFTSYTDAVVRTDADINITSAPESAMPPIFESTNEAIGTVSQLGSVSHVSNGTVGILVKFPQIIRRVDVAVSQSGGQTTEAFTGFETGSLAAHCAQQIDSRIAGLAADASTKGMFSGSPAQWSASCWLAGVDLSCIPYSRNGCLISPRHLYLAAHLGYSVGDTVTFLGSDNQVVTRTVTARQTGVQDIAVALLDSDVPANVSFAKVLPPTYASYLRLSGPNLAYTGVPAVLLDSDRQALVGELRNLESDLGYPAQHTAIHAHLQRSHLDAKRQEFYESLIVGDSGKATFLLINGEPVLLTCWWKSDLYWNSYGPAVCTNYDTVNTLMSNLGGGYQLTAVSLATFNAYI